MQRISEWISHNWLELFGAVSGVVYIILSVKQRVLTWPVGFINSVIYIVVFYQSKFYADMTMQFYYAVVAIYGWILWSGKNNNKSDLPLKVSRISGIQWLIYLCLSLLLSGIIFMLLHYFTDSPIAIPDSLTSGFAIVGTWMLVKKYLENWIFWIVIDLYSSILYAQRELYFTMILYVVFTIMAVVGFKEWKSHCKKEGQLL